MKLVSSNCYLHQRERRFTLSQTSSDRGQSFPLTTSSRLSSISLNGSALYSSTRDELRFRIEGTCLLAGDSTTHPKPAIANYLEASLVISKLQSFAISRVQEHHFLRHHLCIPSTGVTSSAKSLKFASQSTKKQLVGVFVPSLGAQIRRSWQHLWDVLCWLERDCIRSFKSCRFLEIVVCTNSP